MKAVKLFVFLCLVFDWSAYVVAVAPPYPGRDPNFNMRWKDMADEEERKIKQSLQEPESTEVSEALEDDDDEYEWVEVEEGLISAKALAVGAVCVGGAAVAFGARKLMDRISNTGSKKIETKSTAIKTLSKPIATTQSKVESIPSATKTPEAAPVSDSAKAPEPAVAAPVATPEPAIPEEAPKEEEAEVPKSVAADVTPQSETETEPEASVTAVEEPEEEKVEEVQVEETSPEAEEEQVTENPSSSTVSPGGATEAPEAPPMEVTEAEPAADLPDTPFTTIFGDALVEGTGEKGKLQKVHTASALAGKTVGIFFHAKRFDEMLKERGGLDLTSKMAEIYENVKAEGKNFEMVYCGLDASEGDFVNFFDGMPWLSVLQENIETKRDLVQKFQLESFPGVVILNENGELINSQAMTSMLTDPEDFPWVPQTLTETIGDDFVDNMGNGYDADAVKDKVIGLYFSAHWCPPCRQFTPQFAKLYESLKAEGKDFEVIYVSHDKNEETYNEYLAEMPWLAIPYADEKRRAKLQVNLGVGSLPTLVIIGQDGKVINQNGRAEIAMDPEGKEFPWYPKPLKNLAVSADGLTDGPAVIVFAEGSSKMEQDEAIEAIKPIAEASAAAEKATGFFYATQPSQISNLLRKMCALEGMPQEGDKPVMVVLDMQEKSFAVCDEDVNADSIQKFLASIESKELKMTEIDISGIKPEE